MHRLVPPSLSGVILWIGFSFITCSSSPIAFIASSSHCSSKQPTTTTTTTTTTKAAKQAPRLISCVVYRNTCHYSMPVNHDDDDNNLHQQDQTATAAATAARSSPTAVPRRQLLRTALLSKGVLPVLLPVWMLQLVPNVALAGSLLEDYGGSDPTKIVQPKSKADGEQYVVAKKGENAIDPTLRASYYFPTARKRYLPRIQKVSNQLKQIMPTVFSSKNINNNNNNDDDDDDWVNHLQDLYTTADNAILPMKLYTSSLDGQGLRMTQSEFVKSMKHDIDTYEQNVQGLAKALASHDKAKAQLAVNQLSQALADFRMAGKLTDDMEELPSVDEIRRMTMRRPTMKFTQY